MKTTRIKIPIYTGNLVITLCDNWEEFEAEHDIKVNSDYRGLFWHKGYDYMVAFVGEPTISMIAHESLHVVNEVFDYHHIKLDATNDEAQAYFLSWVVDQIEEFLKLTNT